MSEHFARIKKNGMQFEVAIDSDLAMDFKHGKSVSLREVLKDDHIYKDAKKGMQASPTDLKKAFNTDNNDEIAEIIIRQGEVQLTDQYRKNLLEEKKRRIIDLIHTNAIDARTKNVIPVSTIKTALEGIKIDPNEKAEDQLADIVKQLRVQLPLKFETRTIQLIIPAEYGAKLYPIVKSAGTLKKDSWQNDGSYIAVIELPVGMQEEFYNKLNSLTHGKAETKIIE